MVRLHLVKLSCLLSLSLSLSFTSALAANLLSSQSMPSQQTVNSSLLHLTPDMAEKLDIERLEIEGWEVVEEVDGDNKEEEVGMKESDTKEMKGDEIEEEGNTNEEKGEKKKENGGEKENADNIEEVQAKSPEERYLKLDEEIGRGSFKTVFKGELLYAVMLSLNNPSNGRQSISRLMRIVALYKLKVFISETTSFHYFSPKIPKI